MKKSIIRVGRTLAVCALPIGLIACLNQKSVWKGKSSNDGSHEHSDGARTENLSRQKNRINSYSGESSCADTSLAIVGGSQVKNLSLIARSTGRLISTSSRCTATLIGPKHLLTAAHCLAKSGTKPVEVRFGIDPEHPSVSIPVKKWLIHPQYKLGSIVPHHDIAVLVLASSVPQGMTPVPLAVEEELSKGTDIIIAGYGTGGEESQQGLPLSMAQVPLEKVSEEGYFLTEINGKGSCYGDSGGPGFVVDQDTMCLSVAGVVSRASIAGNGKCGQGNTMMNTTYYRNWIEDSFAQLEAPLEQI